LIARWRTFAAMRVSPQLDRRDDDAPERLAPARYRDNLLLARANAARAVDAGRGPRGRSGSGRGATIRTA
jgi:hypothetical protein